MGRRSLLVVGLALALVFAAPAAGDDIEDQKAAVDARIAALQAEISASKQQEGVLTSQLSAVVAELGAAQDAVEEAQSSLGVLETELAVETARLTKLTAQLERQTLRLERLQAQYERSVAILESRVRAIYIEEPLDMLSFLVSASSFDDVIDNVEFLSRIGAQDRRIARQVESAKRLAASERRATASTRKLTAATVSVISARTDEARSVRDRLAVSRDTLSAARGLKQSAVANSRESREEYLAEVDALAAQSATLAAAIRDSQAQAAGSSGTGSPSASGFIWPVDGVVVSGFGMRWGRMHEGIDIAASSGTPIRAAAGGTIIHAGWLGGYGNLVVVDHGNGLATAYAHASSILVAVGQQVSQGQTVSLVGSTGHSSGPHLHFEVRVNGVAVDPLLYL
jgi:murein DD-endopeptidase MepM/ murein hydrolase activator NlpD